MDFKAKSPCKNCPYRKDAPRQLWDKAEFEELLSHDSEQFGRVYGCHKNDNSVCRGYLINQDNRGFPNINLRIALSKAGVSRDYLDALTCTSPLFTSIQEMAKANYPELD